MGLKLQQVSTPAKTPKGGKPQNMLHTPPSHPAPLRKEFAEVVEAQQVPFC